MTATVMIAVSQSIRPQSCAGRVTRPSDGSRYSLVCPFREVSGSKSPGLLRTSMVNGRSVYRASCVLHHEGPEHRAEGGQARGYPLLVVACLVFSGDNTELGRGECPPCSLRPPLRPRGIHTRLASARVNVCAAGTLPALLRTSKEERS